MTDAGSHRAFLDRHDGGAQAERPRFDTYRIRILASTAIALMLLIGVAHLPLSPEPGRVGWRAANAPAPAPISYQELQHTWIEAVPAARTEEVAGETNKPAPPLRDAAPEAVLQTTENPALPSPTSLDSRPAVLNFSENMPNIEGGLTAYYIHITYPEAAIKAGIEGRLVLEFIVGVDGAPSGIEVVKSLHPLCDSAAVRALRKTRFVPGRHNDEVVAVRMRLPVSFELINREKIPPDDRLPADSTLTASL